MNGKLGGVVSVFPTYPMSLTAKSVVWFVNWYRPSPELRARVVEAQVVRGVGHVLVPGLDGRSGERRADSVQRAIRPTAFSAEPLRGGPGCERGVRWPLVAEDGRRWWSDSVARRSPRLDGAGRGRRRRGSRRATGDADGLVAPPRSDADRRGGGGQPQPAPPGRARSSDHRRRRPAGSDGSASRWESAASWLGRSASWSAPLIGAPGVAGIGRRGGTESGGVRSRCARWWTVPAGHCSPSLCVPPDEVPGDQAAPGPGRPDQPGQDEEGEHHQDQDEGDPPGVPDGVAAGLEDHLVDPKGQVVLLSLETGSSCSGGCPRPRRAPAPSRRRSGPRPGSPRSPGRPGPWAG